MTPQFPGLPVLLAGMFLLAGFDAPTPLANCLPGASDRNWITSLDATEDAGFELSVGDVTKTRRQFRPDVNDELPRNFCSS
jgi:hypothetical protein